MSEIKTSMPAWRALVCHKHPWSARLRFLIPQQEGVLLPTPLPKLSQIAENETDGAVLCHPSTALRALQPVIREQGSELEMISEFQLQMETPREQIPVFLLMVSSNDPCPAPEGLQWVEFLQCTRMPWLDREMLRRAYEILIG